MVNLEYNHNFMFTLKYQYKWITSTSTIKWNEVMDLGLKQNKILHFLLILRELYIFVVFAVDDVKKKKIGISGNCITLNCII